MTDITFFSHIATGIAAVATDLPIDDQLQIPVTLNVRAQPSGISHSIHRTVGLYRPCDVIGLDHRAILRTDPDHRIMVGDFEPNYLPIVELAADLPWRFSTEQPVNGRRTPWLALVALAEGEYEEVRAVGGSGDLRLPGIRIHEPGRVLPPATQTGAWAHGQGPGALSSVTPADLEAINSRSLTALRSRLISPRRLRPRTRYRACLIPTFECGRLRGLNPGATHDHVPGYAWSPSTAAGHEFPLYFSWDFGTSAYGDIESLAERIEPRALDSSTGTRPMRIPVQEYQIPEIAPPMRYDGAVVSTNLAGPPEQPAAFTDRLVEVLNAPAALAQDGEDLDASRTPAVAPPLYGQWHAVLHQIEVPAAENDPKAWLTQLNGTSAYRAAAGLGAEVVRRDQEELVAEAWRQVGEVLTAYQRVYAAQLGLLTSARLYERTITKLSDDTLLFMSRPVHAKLRKSGETTLLAELEHSNLRGLPQSAHTRAMLAPRGVEKRVFKRRDLPFDAADVVPSVAANEHVKAQFEPGVVDKALAPFVEATLATMSVSGARPADEPDFAAPLGPGANDIEIDQSAEFAGVQLAPIELASVRREVLNGIDPKVTIPSRVNELIQGVDVSSPTSLYSPIMPAPEFDTPMYAPLRDISPSFVLPGVGEIPQNTAALLASNQEFLEAYMAGINCEMASELLWRGYPATDLRATYFSSFWDSGGDFPDILPIHSWTGQLGSHRPGSAFEPLVLLLKADLILRYAGIMVYAQKAGLDPTTGTYVLGSGESPVVEPIFRGDLTPDTIVVGFNLTSEEARGDDEGHGFFFVLQEQPRESRFGFDEAEIPSGATNWGEITWADVTPASHQSAEPWDGPIDLQAATMANLPSDPPWNDGAAEMAEILFQRPYRIALHGKRLLPPAS